MPYSLILLCSLSASTPAITPIVFSWNLDDMRTQANQTPFSRLIMTILSYMQSLLLHRHQNHPSLLMFTFIVAIIITLLKLHQLQLQLLPREQSSIMANPHQLLLLRLQAITFRIVQLMTNNTGARSLMGCTRYKRMHRFRRQKCPVIGKLWHSQIPSQDFANLDFLQDLF